MFEQVDRALDMVFNALGPRNLKNIARPVDVYAVDASQRLQPSPQVPGKAVQSQQDVRFCRTANGVRLAYSAIGAGPPLVKTGNWMTHLEYDLESPIWRHVWRELAREHTLIRYDTRGNGLSDWDADDISFDAWVSDLEAVCEATKLERFYVLGISQGWRCPSPMRCGIRSVCRHLVLSGGFALGWSSRPRSESQKEEDAAMLTLVRLGWGKEIGLPAAVHVAVRTRRDQGTG